MAEAFFLTAQDRDLLQTFLDASRRGLGNTMSPGGDSYQFDLDDTSPEILLAVVPDGGIRAYNSAADRMYYNFCDIYRLVDLAVSTTGTDTHYSQTQPISFEQQRVYNPLAIDLEGGEYVVVVREKWGNWLALRPGAEASEANTGTSTSTAECTAVEFTQERTRCEDGLLKIYERTVTINNDLLGCPTIDFTDWECVGSVGDCVGTGSCTNSDTGTSTSTNEESCDGTGTYGNSVSWDVYRTDCVTTGTGTGEALQRLRKTITLTQLSATCIELSESEWVEEEYLDCVESSGGTIINFDDYDIGTSPTYILGYDGVNVIKVEVDTCNDYTGTGTDDTVFLQLLGQNFVPGDESTTSTTYVALSTADEVSFTLDEESRVYVSFANNLYVDTVNETGWYQIYFDGVAESDTESGNTQPNASIAVPQTPLLFYEKTLAAGAHTVSVRHKSSGGNTVTKNTRSLAVFKEGVPNV